MVASGLAFVLGRAGSAIAQELNQNAEAEHEIAQENNAWIDQETIKRTPTCKPRS